MEYIVILEILLSQMTINFLSFNDMWPINILLLLDLLMKIIAWPSIQDHPMMNLKGPLINNDNNNESIIKVVNETIISLILREVVVIINTYIFMVKYFQN